MNGTSQPPTREQVYFQTDGEYIKIGRTTRLAELRRKEHQTGNPRPIHTLAVLPGLSEQRLHAQLSPYRVRGEWYRLAPEVVDIIKACQLVQSLQQKHGPPEPIQLSLDITLPDTPVTRCRSTSLTSERCTRASSVQ